MGLFDETLQYASPVRFPPKAHIPGGNQHVDQVPVKSSHSIDALAQVGRSPLATSAHTIRAILLASAMAATLLGRRASNAVSHGRCVVPWILA